MSKKINDLLGYGNLKIVQDKNYFNFSLESILLPNFIKVNKNDNKIIDLGCGNLPMPLIINYLYPEKEIIGIELQKEIYDLAIETLKINNLENKIKVLNIDIKDIKSYFNSESFDIVISNPPYFNKNEQTKINDNKVKSIARHEIAITLEEIIEKASFLLKNKGKFGLVHRTERLDDVIILLKKYNIEPKKIQFIYPKIDKPSNLFLLEGVKNTGKGIKVLKPLIVHDKKNNYSQEIKEIFKI